MGRLLAILTYLTISSTFLYIGLIPDIAILRDREKNPMLRKSILAMLSLGWRSSDREWRHFTRAYLFLAAFATPLVLSVHSVVSFDFATALTPGWHATIFPPYFVAGAIFSGIGMVFTIAIPLRKAFKLQHYITLNDIDAAAKLCLFTSCVVGLAYLTEFQVAWVSGNKFEQDYFWNRVFGPVGMGRVDHADLQLRAPAFAVLAEAPPQHDVALHPLAVHQPWDVVRAVRDRGSFVVA